MTKNKTPAWYYTEIGHVYVSQKHPRFKLKCSKCGINNMYPSAQERRAKASVCVRYCTDRQGFIFQGTTGKHSGDLMWLKPKAVRARYNKS